ncbi:hypothetical protein NBH20_17815 [Rhizobium sp. S153]|uniref:SAM-dependent methyltransferase n=1 Tax=Ciceribacter sichuanensis TaxID=2949647 RepID=A0ABT0VAX4_9HYPH|nr:hypothetical protein [Ciceribacter sp. S153]MCM2403029.1 hypothetical protein [Ciceribacter sp. S153]
MILEALNYAATWPLTTPAHRKAIRYSVNLWSRAGRCAGAWREHEENSKAAIIAAISSLNQRRTAVVLGSGLLRDVPIIELSRAFDTVVLVDLVHLASVRGWLMLKGLKNVRLIERDLGGYDALKAGQEPEPLAFLRQVPFLDFVVSANLLSQIGTGAMKRLEQERPGSMPEDALPRLIRAHIDGLAGLPCKSLLVTDISYEVIDRTGKRRETFDLLHGVDVPARRTEWEWPVVPLGEESKDYRIVHKVIAG